MCESPFPQLPPSFDKLIEVAGTPGAKEIGRTVGNLFYWIFHRPNNYIEKLRIRSQANQRHYEQELASELGLIPPEKLIDPPLSIIGPALEASLYYIDEEVIRKMFAKLIAAACNSEKQSKAHHSFIEIIKQLSPLDASNLELFTNTKVLPIAEYSYRLQNWNHELLHKNVFLSNPNNQNISLQSISLSNLERLGLVFINNEDFLDYSGYPEFKLTPEYNQYVEIASNDPNIVEVQVDMGVTYLTPYGESFIDICLSPK